MRTMKLRPLRSPYDWMQRACLATSLLSSGLMPRADSKIAVLLGGKTVRKVVVVPGKLVNFVVG